MVYETVTDLEYEQKCSTEYEQQCHGYGYHQSCEKVRTRTGFIEVKDISLFSYCKGSKGKMQTNSQED